MVSLYNVEHRDGVLPLEKSLYDVSPHKATSANHKIRVARHFYVSLLAVHFVVVVGGKEQKSRPARIDRLANAPGKDSTWTEPVVCERVAGTRCSTTSTTTSTDNLTDGDTFQTSEKRQDKTLYSRGEATIISQPGH